METSSNTFMVVSQAVLTKHNKSVDSTDRDTRSAGTVIIGDDTHQSFIVRSVLELAIKVKSPCITECPLNKCTKPPREGASEFLGKTTVISLAGTEGKEDILGSVSVSQ